VAIRVGRAAAGFPHPSFHGIGIYVWGPAQMELVAKRRKRGLGRSRAWSKVTQQSRMESLCPDLQFGLMSTTPPSQRFQDMVLFLQGPVLSTGALQAPVCKELQVGGGKLRTTFQVIRAVGHRQDPCGGDGFKLTE
jgi:hypothetical protein